MTEEGKIHGHESLKKTREDKSLHNMPSPFPLSTAVILGTWSGVGLTAATADMRVYRRP